MATRAAVSAWMPRIAIERRTTASSPAQTERLRCRLRDGLFDDMFRVKLLSCCDMNFSVVI